MTSTRKAPFGPKRPFCRYSPSASSAAMGRVGSWSNPQTWVGRPAMADSGKSLACTTTPDLASAVTILLIFISLFPLNVKTELSRTSNLRPATIDRQFGAGREGRVEREEENSLGDLLRRSPALHRNHALHLLLDLGCHAGK